MVKNPKLNEMSSKTLNRYIKKASLDAEKHPEKASKRYKWKNIAYEKNQHKGIAGHLRDFFKPRDIGEQKMKSFKKFIREEGYEPRSPQEGKFIKKHKIKLIDYPVKNEKNVPFKSKLKKDKSKADSYEPGEDAKVYESVEELKELSKATLGRYLDHAVNDFGLSSMDYGTNTALADRKGEEKFRAKQADNSLKYATRRGRGISRAIKKLTKEENELQELSKNTLKSYVKNSVKDVGKRSEDRGSSEMAWLKAPDQRLYGEPTEFQNRMSANISNQDRKLRRRKIGINRALDRLTKEETELQELSSKTLGSYLKKTNDKAPRLMKAGSDEYNKIIDSAKRGDSEGVMTHVKNHEKLRKKYVNVGSGRILAGRKLSGAAKVPSSD